MKFLIVDDSKFARAKMKNFIQEIGYEVVGEACDGLEAINMVKDCSPDCITMDLEMPNIKGDEASKKILMLNKNINIILITSIMDKKELINALKIGVKKILQKPVTQEVFLQTVNDMIEGR